MLTRTVRVDRPDIVVRPVVDGALFVARVTDRWGGISGGACDADAARAETRALGEYAQHVSQTAAHHLIPVLAHDGGRQVVRPHALLPGAGPSPRWVLGTGLGTATGFVVPAEAVFLGWDPPGPQLWAQTSAGTAAGVDAASAREAALREVIERHVLAAGWRTGELTVQDLGGAHDEVLPPRLLEALRRHRVVLRSYRVAQVHPEVVLAVLHRPDGSAFTCGAAARGDTAQALRHAVGEAVSVRLALSSPLPAGTPPSRERERGLDAAAAGPAHLAFLANRCTGPGELRDTPAHLDALLESAQRLFGAEPVEVVLPGVSGLAVRRMVCPGSRIFEAVASEPSPALPCPLT